MSLLSLDFGVLLGGFCIANITFYQRLLSSTLLLLGAVGVIILRSQLTKRQAAAKESRAKQGVFVAIYVLLFERRAPRNHSPALRLEHQHGGWRATGAHATGGKATEARCFKN
jgi:hypothetical protein